jgi:N-acetylglucosamine-6-phosphate deacetylase
MNNKKAYTAGTVFTGTDKLRNHSVLTVDGRIEAMVPSIAVPEDFDVKDFGKSASISPALVDLQLYGANNRLLAVYPDAQTVGDIVQYCRNGGAAWCMPTVATNTYEVFFKCIDAIRSYWQQGGKGALGLHVEGPWISMEKRGAHNPDWIFSPSLDQVKELVEYGKDVIKIITLAPEVCTPEILEYIQLQKIIVSAGHSNATYEQATHTFNNTGVDTVTHLYNAMSPMQHRAPGLVGAVLDHPLVKAAIIPDGHHVDYAAIRIAKKILNERLFAITDAVTTTTEGYYKHEFAGDKYTANGILSGSSLTMHKAFKNLVVHAGVKVDEALRMCSLYPARVVKYSDQIALLKNGYPANMIVFDKALNLVETICLDC